MIEIIPAIDLIGGRTVRLSKGDYDSVKVYEGHPEEVAERYRDCGVRRIHIVDLDGAKESKPCNLSVLEKVASKVDIEIEWGGGVSSDEALKSVFDAGATFAIIGSVAVRKPELFKGWLGKYGAKCILGTDVRGKKVAVKGWLEDSDMTIDQVIANFKDVAGGALREVICTDISRDGMLQGPNVNLYKELQSDYSELSFTVSGGISSMSDIETLSDAGLLKVIVGKALYENRITLKELEQWSLRG